MQPSAGVIDKERCVTPVRRGGHHQRGTVWPRVGARWGRRPDVVGPPGVCDELRVGLTDGGYTGCAMRAHWVRVECAQGMQSTRLGTSGAHTGARVLRAHTRCAGRAHESSQMSCTGHTEGTSDARSALGARDSSSVIGRDRQIPTMANFTAASIYLTEKGCERKKF